MNRNTVTAFLAGSVLAGAIALGFGAHASAPLPIDDEAAWISAAAVAHPGAHAPQGPGHRRGMAGRRGAMLRALQDPAMATIFNLRALERVYRRDGRTADVEAMYRDVLGKTDNATVRNFANLRLARIAMRAQDAKGAEDLLEKNLQENLGRLR